MIEVTEAAKKHLKSLLDSKSDDPAAMLRLYVSAEGELGIGVDIATGDDQFIEHENARLIAVSKELADKFSGITLDVETQDGSPQLVASCDGEKKAG